MTEEKQAEEAEEAAAQDEAAEGGGAGEGEDDAEAAEPYPPETFRFMSWAAIRFINRPSLRPLAYAAYALIVVLGGGAIGSLFLHINVRAPGAGEIVAYPGVLQAQAQSDGLMSTPIVKPGARVEKGQVLAVLQLDMQEFQVEAVAAGLERNLALVEAADRRTGLSPEVEEARVLARIRDPVIRDAAVSMQGAVRRLRQSLETMGEFGRDKEEVLQLVGRLQGLLMDYLERHRVRAPAAGVVLQYDASTNANVSPGTTIATILPEGAEFEVRLYVEPKDVANVAVGQAVRHQLAAYPHQRYGLFEGEVIAIEQTTGPEGRLVYEIRSTVRKPENMPARLAASVRLVRGMKAASEIVTGEMTIYDMLMDSFFGSK